MANTTKKETLTKKKTTKSASTTKNTKEKKSRKKPKILKTLLTIILAFILLGFISAASFIGYIVLTTEKFDPEKLDTTESSRIFFNDGTLLGTVGTEMREKITYDQISEVLVDAIVATEDSRFFQHNGFNGARFFKATIQQLLHHSGGGASTITMQVSKNNLTSTTADGIEGIIRKFRDIYISVFQIEKNYTKEEIMEFYVNYPFLGSNTHGIEQACRTYFGKSASEVSLPEAALIAGLFQAPGAYDPYIYPEAAEARRAVVLDLMVRHGYITKEEAKIANSISVESLLKDDYSTGISEYQVLLDTVITDIRNELELDPYQVSMDIYTTFDKKKQDKIDEFYETYPFLDKKVQVGIALIDNKDGSIAAIGGGRNKTRAFSYNYATQTFRHIGSTAKPLFDYGPAIEYMNWSTYTPLFDEKVNYSDGGTMYNWDMRFMGLMTAKSALAESRNTTALQTFQINDVKNIKKFVLSLGMTPEIDAYGGLHEAHAVGAFSGTNPVQLAGAYSAFARSGYYTKPYSYTKILFRDTNKTIENDITKEKVMKDSTAYMITWMLYGVTPYNSVTGTNIATKTGTSSYDTKTLTDRGLSTQIIQDSWVATYSPDYTMTFWYGYDKLYDKYNMTMNTGSVERTKIQRLLLNSLFKKNSTFTQPSSVVASRVELESFPPKMPSNNTPSKYSETHLFVKGTQPTEVSTRFSTLEDPTNVVATSVGNMINITWDASKEYNQANDNSMRTYLNEYYGKLADRYYEKLSNKKTSNLGTFGYDIYVVDSSGDEQHVGFTSKNNYSFDASIYSVDQILVKTAYSKFKNNSSEGVYVYVDGSMVEPEPEPEPENNCKLVFIDKYDADEVTRTSSNPSYTEEGNSVYVMCDEEKTDADITKLVTGLLADGTPYSKEYDGSDEITINKPGEYKITYSSDEFDIKLTKSVTLIQSNIETEG